MEPGCEGGGFIKAGGGWGGGRGLGGKDRDYLEIEFWTIKARRLSLVGLCQQVARDCHRRCGA